MVKIIIILISIIGILLSVYAYYVEIKSKEKNYHAGCDISNKISCTKIFNSRYGKLVGVSNSLLGIIFYFVVIVLFYIRFELIFYMTLLSVLGSLYLAYLQFFRIKSFCLVCSSVYILNILLLIFSVV